MIDPAYCRLMAAYNGWMNERLYTFAATLSDAQRRQDRGAFFKSLHGTLHHLLWADQIWLNRFKGRPLDTAAPPAAADCDFDYLRQRRSEIDREISEWVEGVQPQWLAADFSYYSKAYDATFTRLAWMLVVHLFNHQTHHRGQATTLLSQFGIDPGVTDLPVLPDIDRIAG